LQREKREPVEKIVDLSLMALQDGHYALSYSANRAIVSAAEAKKMEQVVRSAQIVQQ